MTTKNVTYNFLNDAALEQPGYIHSNMWTEVVLL